MSAGSQQKFSMSFNKATYAILQELMAAMGTDSIAAGVREALYIAGFVLEHRKDGWDIVAADSDGNIVKHLDLHRWEP